MIHESKKKISNSSPNVTRREFFRTMAVLGLVTFSTKPLYAKGSKEQFKYQDTPKNAEACKDCIHFMADTNECKIVEGSISPEGWCTLYQKPPS